MKYLIFLIFTTPLATKAKSFNCESEFHWLKGTFENNDAGFQHAVSIKGESSYESHNVEYLQAIKGVEDESGCHEQLQEWLTFFRNGHLSLRLNSEESIDETVSSPIYAFDEVAFKRHLKSKAKADLEGVWQFSGYKVGLKKEGEDYKGYVIESLNSNWRKGQIKLTFHENADSSYKVTYLMGDHSPTQIDSVKFLDNNNLILGENFLTLSRQEPRSTSSPEISRYVRLFNSSGPKFELLSNETALLRIPTFGHSYKKDIDKVINDNLDTILRTENLIIDIRGNDGGSDVSYKNILPIIYTNPIRKIGVEYLSTSLNNSRMLKFAEDPNFSEDGKTWAKKSFNKLQKHLGKFINLNEHSVSTETFEQIHPLPKTVGVLIDYGNISTAEQFLLAAKQSQKVKLFGTTTRGVLDISNMYRVTSPSNKFTLHYSLSKSLRIPDMAIDGKGIQPDFYIDSNIPITGWISHTQKILEEK